MQRRVLEIFSGEVLQANCDRDYVLDGGTRRDGGEQEVALGPRGISDILSPIRITRQVSEHAGEARSGRLINHVFPCFNDNRRDRPIRAVTTLDTDTGAVVTLVKSGHVALRLAHAMSLD